MCTHTGFEVAYKTKHNNVELQIEEKESQHRGGPEDKVQNENQNPR